MEQLDGFSVANTSQLLQRGMWSWCNGARIKIHQHGTKSRQGLQSLLYSQEDVWYQYIVSEIRDQYCWRISWQYDSRRVWMRLPKSGLSNNAFFQQHIWRTNTREFKWILMLILICVYLVSQCKTMYFGQYCNKTFLLLVFLLYDWMLYLLVVTLYLNFLSYNIVSFLANCYKLWQTIMHQTLCIFNIHKIRKYWWILPIFCILHCT